MGRPDSRAAAFFDVDRTIASSNLLSVYLDLALEGKGLLSRGVWITAFLPKIPLYAYLDWTDRVRFIKSFFKNYKGLQVESVQTWAERRGPEYWRPRLFEEALREIESHREKGNKVVLLTGGLMEMVKPLGNMLGVDAVMASRGRVSSGRFLGELETGPLSGSGKASAARQWADAADVDLARSYAYADDISDLPLLELVGSPVAVNPERRLENLARTRGWPVHRWSGKGSA